MYIGSAVTFQMIIFNIIAFSLLIKVKATNPIIDISSFTLYPKLVSENGTKCHFDLLQATFSNFGSSASSLLPPIPAECLSQDYSSKFILRLKGEGVGVNYDRYGQIWFNNVEICRHTTPKAIGGKSTWNVDVDVTDYASLLLSHHEKGEIRMALDTVVNPSYSAAYSFTLSLLILELEEGPFKQKTKPLDQIIVPLVSSIQLRDSAPLLRLNLAKASHYTSKNPIDAFIRFHVSGHGCEEFFYANTPDKDNGCVGPVKELYLHYNDTLLDIAPLAPNVYAGGPYNWVPVMAPGSMSIEPFDVPIDFLVLDPLTGHGATLDITIGPNISSFWLVSASLFISTNEDAPRIVNLSTSLTTTASPPFLFDKESTGTSASYNVSATRSVLRSTTLLFSDGSIDSRILNSSIEYHASLWFRQGPDDDVSSTNYTVDWRRDWVKVKPGANPTPPPPPPPSLDKGTKTRMSWSINLTSSSRGVFNNPQGKQFSLTEFFQLDHSFKWGGALWRREMVESVGCFTSSTVGNDGGGGAWWIGGSWRNKARHVVKGGGDDDDLYVLEENVLDGRLVNTSSSRSRSRDSISSRGREKVRSTLDHLFTPDLLVMN